MSKPQGKCLHCGKSATLVCVRCSGHYCSNTCQLSDWPVHKKNCIPDLVNKPTSSTGTSNSSLPPQCTPHSSEEYNRRVSSHPKRELQWSARSDSVNVAIPNVTPRKSVNERLKIRRSEREEEKSGISEAFNNLAVSNPTARQAEGCSVLLGLEVGTTGVCYVRKRLPGVDFGVTIVHRKVREDFDKLFADIIETFKKTRENECYQARVGETVAAYADLGDPLPVWMRARVIDIVEAGSFLVNFCDLGRTETVKSVYKLPDDISGVPEFGACCTIEKLFIRKVLKEDLLFQFRVYELTYIEKSLVIAHCKFYTDTGEEVGAVTLKPWKPIRTSVLNNFSLKNNDSVIMSVYFNPQAVYVRPSCDEFKKSFTLVQENVKLHCFTAPGIEHLPKKDDLVACKFMEDESFYRARVIHLKEDLIQVRYIDFGNEDWVAISQLKCLSSELRNIPELAVKVSLKNVENKPLSKLGTSLIASLCYKEAELKIVVEDTLENGVEIFLSDGKSLNVELSGSHSLK